MVAAALLSSLETFAYKSCSFCASVASPSFERNSKCAVRVRERSNGTSSRLLWMKDGLS